MVYVTVEWLQAQASADGKGTVENIIETDSTFKSFTPNPPHTCPVALPRLGLPRYSCCLVFPQTSAPPACSFGRPAHL